MMVRLEDSGWPGDVSQDTNASEITPRVGSPHRSNEGCEPGGAGWGGGGGPRRCRASPSQRRDLV